MSADMATGAVAQLAAGLVFTPMDIIKERGQVSAIFPAAFKSHGFVTSLQHLVGQMNGAGLGL